MKLTRVNRNGANESSPVNQCINKDEPLLIFEDAVKHLLKRNYNDYQLYPIIGVADRIMNDLRYLCNDAMNRFPEFTNVEAVRIFGVDMRVLIRIQFRYKGELMRIDNVLE